MQETEYRIQKTEDLMQEKTEYSRQKTENPFDNVSR
jgi:hypothetical protein